MPEAAEKLDRLIEALQTLDGSRPERPDAMDRVLASAARTTQPRDLRSDPAVTRFREDLANGLVRVESTAALLDVVSRVIQRVAGL